MSHPKQHTTRILRQARAGDAMAADELLPIVYAELRRVAGAYLAREKPGHTLQPTALVHEAYLRLVDTNGTEWEDEAHFLAIAARVMRQILVDHARRRGAGKRGGDRRRVPLEEGAAFTDPSGVDVLALQDAIETLASFDARKAQIADLRLFLGLTVAETARVVGLAAKTTEKEWGVARAWLRVELDGANRSNP